MNVRKFKAWLLAVALGMGAAVPAGAKTWIKAESAHFTVYSDIDAKTAAAYLVRLEKYRYVLGGFYGIGKDEDEAMPKLPVYFVDSLGDLRQTWPSAPDDVAGYFKDCVNGQAAVSLFERGQIQNTTSVRGQDENQTQVVLFHEYAHDFMFQHSNKAYPHWFVVGFAEFYSTTKIQGDQIIVGMSSSWRRNSLMYAQQWSIPYAELLRDTWQKKGQWDAHRVDAFYAQSWLLTHYILSDPNREKQLHVFVDSYRAGQDPVAAFEAAFGVKVKDLDNVLSAYFNRLSAMQYQISGMPTPVVTTTSLPPSANKLLLWDAADRLCPATDTKPALLAKIQAEAAKYPGDAFAEDVLARAEIIIGDESQALDYLKQRVADHPDDAQGYFMLGQTWYLMTAHKHILGGQTAQSQMEAARAALGKSYKLDPLDPPDLYYYSLALAVPGEPPSDNMIAAATQAHDLAPSVDIYAMHAARLLVRRGRLAEAKDVMVVLAGNPHQPKLAAWAANVMAVIDRQGSQQEVLAALDTPFDADAANPAPKTPPGGGGGN
jgi:hypothetical protein